jgi:hypothetical protein
LKLIVVTPAGRERYLRLLAHYVLSSPQVSAWHLWENCRNEADRAFLHRLAASDPRCKIKELPGADGSPSMIGGFWRFCDDPDALYLRLDDDIVYVEDGFFPRFIERAMAERGKAIWFTPLVVNNAVCNTLLQSLSNVIIEGHVTCQAMCPYSWAHAEFPMALHPVLIEAARTGRLGDFRVPDREIRLSRFSINAIAFFGSDKVALGDQFYPIGCADEEEWISAVLPARLNRPAKILGDLLVAHFSFYTQERRLLQTDILESYYELAGLPPHVYEKPRNSRGLRDVLRPRRRRRRGPEYRIRLRKSQG